jgi:hypothetical protein
MSKRKPITGLDACELQLLRWALAEIGLESVGDPEGPNDRILALYERLKQTPPDDVEA